MMEELTIVEKNFIRRLKRGAKASKLGNKIYFQRKKFVTKEFQIGISNIEKLIDNGWIRIVEGGKIVLNEKSKFIKTNKK